MEWRDIEKPQEPILKSSPIPKIETLWARKEITIVIHYKPKEWNKYTWIHTDRCGHMLSHFSCVQLCNPVTHQIPLSMGFSRQEYWSGLPCPPPGDLPNLVIKSRSLMSPALAGRFFTTSATWEAYTDRHIHKITHIYACRCKYVCIISTHINKWENDNSSLQKIGVAQ